MHCLVGISYKYTGYISMLTAFCICKHRTVMLPWFPPCATHSTDSTYANFSCMLISATSVTLILDEKFLIFSIINMLIHFSWWKKNVFISVALHFDTSELYLHFGH